MKTDKKEKKRYTYQEYKEVFFPKKQDPLLQYDDPYDLGVALSELTLEQARKRRKSSSEANKG
jgi:hypothetical protein